VAYYVNYVSMWFKKSLNGEMVKCLDALKEIVLCGLLCDLCVYVVQKKFKW